MMIITIIQKKKNKKMIHKNIKKSFFFVSLFLVQVCWWLTLELSVFFLFLENHHKPILGTNFFPYFFFVSLNHFSMENGIYRKFWNKKKLFFLVMHNRQFVLLLLLLSEKKWNFKRTNPNSFMFSLFNNQNCK